MTEWDRQELLKDFGLSEVSNCRGCAKCGRPLIDVVFEPGMMDQFNVEKKVDDICITCMYQASN